MGNKNYSKFYNKNFKETADGQMAMAEVVEEVQEPVTEEIHDEPTVVEETVEITETHAEPIKGKVVGCDKLRVRSGSDTNADVISILDKDTEIIIDLENSTEEFYKVTTASGLEGYCMIRFIKIEE